MNGLTTISPVDGRVLVTRPHAREAEIASILERSARAQRTWRSVPLADRSAHCTRFVEAMLSERDAIAEEITLQVGRPISQSPGELRGFEERARAMVALAPMALEPISPGPKPGFHRKIERVPLGVVLTIAPWNYPFLTAVNSIVPALLAGNTVILKHSAQTPLVAERFAQAFASAGLPEGVFQFVHCSHADTERMIQSPTIAFVAFTGSVAGGHAVQAAASKRFIATGLELGGKDPAYVRPDADLAHAVENLVDGAFFNSGQSCCGIERIYVHDSIFDEFVERFATLTREYRLGNPLDKDVNLGPVVKTAAADHVRGQIAEAVSKGAKALIDPTRFTADKLGTPYLAPQVLVNVDHGMRVMTEESFGPVVGIMAVKDDEQAVQLMNDSDYGLTASVWTRDESVASALGEQVETGTWFMNRCDYLDPLLAWTGVKDSGRGCTLSEVGFEMLTRPKSFHFRL
ncbi:MAG TPA: aldehyde dehydrogenase family protein [Polyangiaceae bacterium]|jgi:acyl-CoA reductase-like NAD-dependent aldehyde dehydrogenase|nr:aldehyde dehydrogenase family protein [Polyangiaceae bacterium]